MPVEPWLCMVCLHICLALEIKGKVGKGHTHARSLYAHDKLQWRVPWIARDCAKPGMHRGIRLSISRFDLGTPRNISVTM